MFALAKLARTRGDVPEAIRLSKQIEQFFPSSEEGINTHLALGVLYLQQGQQNLALQEFATFRRIGSSELKAEAYFGQAQALRQLERTDDERLVLEELLQSYPRSAYVAAAQVRLRELLPDAGGD
jgi:TolA-binding protein